MKINGSPTRLLFSGKVQGVGFRRTTQRLALDLGLSGWVRNLPDGQVEAVVSGSSEPIEALIDELFNRFEIERMERNDHGDASKSVGFDICT